MKFLLLFIILYSSLAAGDGIFYYEEALKAEKISPYFAIPLYETFLEKSEVGSFRKAAVSRLFDLYMQNGKYEDLLILSSKQPLDKRRQKKLQQIFRHIAKDMDLPEQDIESFFKDMINGSLGSTKDTLNRHMKGKNQLMVNYIFALKFRTKDFDSLEYLIREYPEINPILRLAYFVNKEGNEAREYIRETASLTELSDEQKMELLYLYGIYFMKKKNYANSARFFMMSASYDSNEDGRLSGGILSTSKALYLTGRKNEACSLISGKKLNIRNESDEFMRMLCSSEESKKLPKLTSSFSILAGKESGQVFELYIGANTRRKQKASKK